jgi:hypothetical protein
VLGIDYLPKEKGGNGKAVGMKWSREVLATLCKFCARGQTRRMDNTMINDRRLCLTRWWVSLAPQRPRKENCIISM